MPSEEMMILISAREAAMSEKTITRYDLVGDYDLRIDEVQDGDYVLFADHESALADKDARIAELEGEADGYRETAEEALQELSRLRAAFSAKAGRFERKAKKYRKWVDSTERAFADTYEECAAEIRALLGEGK